MFNSRLKSEIAAQLRAKRCPNHNGSIMQRPLTISEMHVSGTICCPVEKCTWTAVLDPIERTTPEQMAADIEAQSEQPK